MEAIMTEEGLIEAMNRKESPLVQVKTLSCIVKYHVLNQVLLEQIMSLTEETDVYPKVWGLTDVTLADFAVATLYWLQTSESLSYYDHVTECFSSEDWERIKGLITTHVYEYLC